MSECITKPLTSYYSGCLVENQQCPHSVRVGFSNWCKHSEHQNFYGHIVHGLSREELSKRYEMLRQRRIKKFLADMDESIRKQFMHHEEWRETLKA